MCESGDGVGRWVSGSEQNGVRSVVRVVKRRVDVESGWCEVRVRGCVSESERA